MRSRQGSVSLNFDFGPLLGDDGGLGMFDLGSQGGAGPASRAGSVGPVRE